MVEHGYNDQQAAEQVGITWHAFANWRRKNGYLRPGRKKRKVEHNTPKELELTTTQKVIAVAFLKDLDWLKKKAAAAGAQISEDQIRAIIDAWREGRGAQLDKILVQ